VKAGGWQPALWWSPSVIYMERHAWHATLAEAVSGPAAIRLIATEPLKLRLHLASFGPEQFSRCHSFWPAAAAATTAPHCEGQQRRGECLAGGRNCSAWQKPPSEGVELCSGTWWWPRQARSVLASAIIFDEFLSLTFDHLSYLIYLITTHIFLLLSTLSLLHSQTFLIAVYPSFFTYQIFDHHTHQKGADCIQRTTPGLRWSIGRRLVADRHGRRT